MITDHVELLKSSPSFKMKSTITLVTLRTVFISFFKAAQMAAKKPLTVKMLEHAFPV